MINRYKRQIDLVDPDLLKKKIVVIGAGGIGSWTILALAKMGCTNISVIDFDKVEDHNVASQFYKESQKTQLKVEALAENVKDFSGTEIIAINGKWEDSLTAEMLDESILIVALDSLDERRKLFEFVKLNGYPTFYIDARMGGEILRIFSMSSEKFETYGRYNKNLTQNKTKVHHEICTARAIVYNTFMAGSAIANMVKKLVKSEEVPYETTIDMSNQLMVI